MNDSQAVNFFKLPGPNNTVIPDGTPAGIHLPLDNLAGVGVRILGAVINGVVVPPGVRTGPVRFHYSMYDHPWIDQAFSMDIQWTVDNGANWFPAVPDLSDPRSEIARPGHRVDERQKVGIAGRLPEDHVGVAVPGGDRAGRVIVGGSVDDGVREVRARAHREHVDDPHEEGYREEHPQGPRRGRGGGFRAPGKRSRALQTAARRFRVQM